jgi:GT2 family glycosyltransferase
MDTKADNEFPLVYVILINWNQPDLTIACIDSLNAISYSNARILLLDNGSQDDSVVRIRTCFPDVLILENHENLGFSGANNIGIEFALAQGADYVLLLNNDTVVAPDFLDLLICTAENDSDIGVVTPKIYYYDFPDRIWCAGAHIDWKTGETHRLRADHIDYSTSTDTSLYSVNFVSGCAMCIKRHVLEAVGLLDTRFFIYYEETDLCARITRAGYRLVYVPKSRIWHKVSAAMGISSPKTIYYMTRNQILFLCKNTIGLIRAFIFLKVFAKHSRTLLSYSLKKDKSHLKNNRKAMLIGIRDGLLGRYGKADV